MARRFRTGLRPVNRIKHVIDTQSAVAAGAQAFVTLINTVDAPVLANTADCETSSIVNGIYLKVEVTNVGTTGVLANVYMIVIKNPGGNLTFPLGNVIGSSDNKKYVFHQEMIMLQQIHDSNPRTLFNGVIAIPKGYRRNGPNDQILVGITAPGTDTNFCVQCHYKEFR